MPEIPLHTDPTAPPVPRHQVERFLARVEHQVRGTRPPPAQPAGVVPAAPCEVCGAMVAASTRTRDPALGLACILCTGAANEIRRRQSIAQSRQRRDWEAQLRAVVKDVRSGTTEYPTFDQPDF